jgi:acyl phosphate:glycerol-3-phosphate acyltransferase
MPAFETAFWLLGLIGIGAYLLGSVPFGIVVARAMGLGDPRTVGSGNIGATNVLRMGSRPAAAATLVLDAGKGAVAVLFAGAIAGGDAAQLAGLAAFFGHVFPVFLGFRGGKGVATLLGILLILAWPVGLVACGMWLLTAALTRISSLSALVAAAGSAPVALLLGQWEMTALCLLLAALVFWTHRANIARLRAGTEPRIGQRKG